MWFFLLCFECIAILFLLNVLKKREENLTRKKIVFFDLQCKSGFIVYTTNLKGNCFGIFCNKYFIFFSVKWEKVWKTDLVFKKKKKITFLTLFFLNVCVWFAQRSNPFLSIIFLIFGSFRERSVLFKSNQLSKDIVIWRINISPIFSSQRMKRLITRSLVSERHHYFIDIVLNAISFLSVSILCVVWNISTKATAVNIFSLVISCGVNLATKSLKMIFSRFIFLSKFNFQFFNDRLIRSLVFSLTIQEIQ